VGGKTPPTHDDNFYHVVTTCLRHVYDYYNLSFEHLSLAFAQVRPFLFKIGVTVASAALEEVAPSVMVNV
jgi:hypothetical protein